MFGKSKKKDTLSRRDRAALKKAEKRYRQQRQAELERERKAKKKELKRRQGAPEHTNVPSPSLPSIQNFSALQSC